jgi:SNF2 family DNA or RNA helicase
MAANLFDQPLPLPPDNEGSQDQEPKPPVPPKTPVAPPKAKVSQPDWASIKPKDVLTQDWFHQLDMETRRYILNKVSPEFANAPKEGQDNELNVDKGTWNDYFKNTPETKETWWLDDLLNWTKQKVRQTEDLITGAFVSPTQRMRAVVPSGPGIPATFAPPPEPTPQVAPAVSAPLAPPPEISERLKYPAVPQFEKRESFQDWLNKQPPMPVPSTKVGKPPEQREVGGDIDRLSREIGVHRQDIDLLSAEIKDRWPGGPDTTNREDVNEYNSRVTKIRSVIGEAGPKIKALGDLITLGQEIGAIKVAGAPVDKDLRAMMDRMKTAKGPFISALPPEQAAAMRYGEVPEGYGQPSLAEKIYVSAIESFGNAWAYNIGKFQPEEYKGEELVRMVAGVPGFLGSMAFLGGGTMAEMIGISGKIGQIPVVANWLERLRVLPAAKKAIEAVKAIKEVDQTSAKLAVKVLAQQALKNPNFEKTLLWGLENPNKLSWAVRGIAGAENSLALATAGTITALGRGESVPNAIARAVAFGVGGEVLKYAPGIRNLAQTFKMDITDPKISQLLRGMATVANKEEAETIKIQAELLAASRAGWSGTLLDPTTATKEDLLAAQAVARAWVGDAVNRGMVDPNAFRFSVVDTIRDMARARYPEYEQFKKFIEDYANETHRTSIGTALQSAVSYGLAAAGITAVETPGNLATRLSAAGEDGFITFLQIAGFHIPSIARAFQAKYGRAMTPSEMTVGFADMSGQERKQIVAGITPEDLTDAARRANEFSGKTVEPEVAAAAPEAPLGMLPTVTEIPPTELPIKPPIPVAPQPEPLPRPEDIGKVAAPHEMEELPEGVVYNGPQQDLQGNTVFFLYTDTQTGSTFAVKPGEKIADELKDTRAKFAVAAEEIEKAQEPTPQPLAAFVITRDQEDKLRGLDYSDNIIGRLRPEQAQSILAKNEPKNNIFTESDIFTDADVDLGIGRITNIADFQGRQRLTIRMPDGRSVGRWAKDVMRISESGRPPRLPDRKLERRLVSMTLAEPPEEVLPAAAEAEIPPLEPVPGEENAFLKGMADAEWETETRLGNFVAVDEVRKQFPTMTRGVFDAAVFRLARAGHLVLGGYDGPRPLPGEDLSKFVEDENGNLYIGLARPREGEEISPTLEPPLAPEGKAPIQLFSYAADLPNTVLTPAKQRMAESFLQQAINLDIAEPIIEGLLDGKSLPRLADEIKQTLGGKADWSIAQIRIRIIQIRDLKGIPESGSPSLAKFADNARDLKRAASGEVLPSPPPEIEPEAPQIRIKLRTTGQKDTGEDLLRRNPGKFKTATVDNSQTVGILSVNPDEALDLARFYSDASKYLSSVGQMRKGIQAWEIANELAEATGYSLKDITPLGGKVTFEPPPLEGPPEVQWTKARIIPTRAGYKTELIPPEAPPPTFGAEHPLSNLSGGPLLPPEPEAVPQSQSEKAKRARDIIRKKISKRAAEVAEMAVEGIEIKGPTREQLRTDPDIFDAMTALGDDYYNTGVADKAVWHATLYRDMEDIAEGLGEDLEPLFPDVWEAVTGNKDYEGGVGGIYGARYGDVEDLRGGRGGAGDYRPLAEGGGRAVRGGEPAERPEPRPTAELSTEPGVKGTTPAADLESAQRDARYTFRGRPPVVLTRGQRIEINEKVRQLVESKQPGDPLTDEEKNLLRQYTGSGGLSAMVKERGTLYEHYTSYRMAVFLWDKLRAMGFPMDNLTIMDPAHGIGNCSSGFAPADSKIFATEIDPLAVQVSRLLFPDVKISDLHFEEYPPRKDIDVFSSNVPFNAARGACRYRDEAKEYEDIHQMHDFFFVKSLDMTRPNGVVMFITGIGTMDKTGNEKPRKEINKRAEFLGAYRTPGGEFSKNTQYEGSTDIIFLRKRTPEEMESWTDNMYQDEFIYALDPEESGIGAKVSTYYMKHPEKVWGTLEAGYNVQHPTMMGVRPFQKEGPGGKKIPDQDRYLQAIAHALTDDIRYIPKETQAAKIATEEAADREILGNRPQGMKIGTVVWDEEKEKFGYASKDGFILHATEMPREGKTHERVRKGLRLVEFADDLFTALRDNDIAGADKLRAQVRPLLDAYKRTYATPKDNPSGDPTKDKTLWRYLGGGPQSAPFPFADPRIWKLAALTNVDGSPGDIFTNNSIYVPPPEVRDYNKEDLVDTAKFVYETTGEMNWSEVAQRYQGTMKPEDLVGHPDFSIAALDQDGKPIMEVNEEYLYGSIWPKIDQTAQMAGDIQNRLDQIPEGQKTPEVRNRAANVLTALSDQLIRLKAVLPEQAQADEIIRRSDPFSAYIEDRVIQHWLAELTPGRIRAEKVWDGDRGRMVWALEADRASAKLNIRIPSTEKYQDEIGLEKTRPIEKDFRLDFQQIENYMRHIRVRKEVPTGEVNPKGEIITKTIYDEDGEKAYAVLAQMFRDWSLQHISLFDRVIPKYNRGYRSFRERFYSDKQLDINGLSTMFKGSPLKIQAHQWQGVGRAAHIGSGIVAYGVGGGKTLTAILLVEHLKQRNKVRKPILTVPAAVVKNWAYEINQALPDATIIDLSGLDATNRYKMLQRAAVTDADFILITHEGMKEIPLRKSEEYIQEDIRKLEDRLRAVQVKKDKRTETQIQNQILKYEEKLAKLQQMKRTNTIFFEDLGSDAIIVDEAHRFKNTPKDYGDMSDYVRAGKWSQRAADMQYKTRYIHERRGGRKGQNVWMLTATPTPNHPSEIYAMMGYVAPEEWTSRGILNAGDFMGQFGRIETREVQTATGVPKAKTVWAGYKNLTELRAIFRRYVDFRTIEDLKIPRPEGIYIDHVLDPTDAVTECAGYIAWLQEYVNDHLQQAAAEGINHLSVLTLARKLAADPAIFDPRKYAASFGGPGSKLEAVVKEVLAGDTGENTQLIFCDLYRGGYLEEPVDTEEGKIEEGDDEDSVQKEQNSKHFVELVNIHKHFKQKLMDSGVPESQIAIVNGQINSGANAKFKIQQANAEGKIRFLIGSRQSMGEGMNLQTDTTQVHHFDVPWTGSALEQADGRGLRQGNRNESIRIHRYLVRGTSDAKLYDTIAGKDVWIKEVYRGNADEMLDFDEDGRNFRQLADAAAIPQATLDYYRAKHAVHSVDGELEAIDQVEERVLHHLKVMEDDIKNRQERIKELEDDIAKGYGSDWDRRRMQSHQEHLAQLMKEHPDYNPEAEDKRKAIAARRDLLHAEREKATLYIGIYEEAKLAGRLVEDLEATRPEIANRYGAGGKRSFLASSYIINVGRRRKKKRTPVAQEVVDAGAAQPEVADMPAFEGHPDPQLVSGPLADPLYTPLPEPPEIAEYKKREMPIWTREEELGPSYLFTSAVTQADKTAMSSGTIPTSITDDMKANSDIDLSSAAKITKGTLGWIINDGTRRFRILPYDNRSVDIFEIEAWGRIQAPELMNLADDLIQIASQHGVKEAIKLSTRLRTSYGRFVGERMKEHIELRPELFEPGNREVLARVLAHEIGHLVDWVPTATLKRGNLLGRLTTLSTYLKNTMPGVMAKAKELRKELIFLSEYWHPYDLTKARPGYIRLRRQSQELYADFVSALLNSPGTARKYAPKFYREFHAHMDTKPDVKTEYLKLRAMMAGATEEKLDDRLVRTLGMLVDAERSSAAVELKEPLKGQGFIGSVKGKLVYRLWMLDKHIEGLLKYKPTAIDDKDNPEIKYDALPFNIANRTWEFADRVNREIMQEIIEKAGITIEDLGFKASDLPSIAGTIYQDLTAEHYGPHIVLGLYMYLHRTATGRADVANPKIVGGEFAAETLDRFQERIGPEKFAALEQAAHAYEDITWELVEKGFDLQIYPERARKKFEEDKYNYVKFVAEKYIDQYVSPTVKAQIGYTGAFENPILSDLKMRFALIKMIVVYGARRSFIENWKQFWPDEIYKAKRQHPTDIAVTWERPVDANGKAVEGFDIVEMMEDGRRQGYWVDKYLADGINHPNAEALQDWAQWMNLVHKLWWKVIILYNLSFGAFGNPVRDFVKNFRALPFELLPGNMLQKLWREWGAGDFTYLLDAYRRSFIHVYRHMKNHGDPLLREMIRNDEISAPTLEAPETEYEHDAFNLTMKRAGIYRPNGTLDKRATIRMYRGAKNVLGGLAYVAEFAETLGKVSGHQVRVAAGETGPRLGMNMRRNTGTPAWYRKGSWGQTFNRLLAFPTMFIQGWHSEINLIADPVTRSGFFHRTMKVLSVLIAANLIFGYYAVKIFGPYWGKKIKWAWDGITGYKKRMYLNVLFGLNRLGEAISFQVPLDEGCRMLWGIINELMDGYAKDDPEMLTNIYNHVVSQLPSPTPWIQIPITVGRALAGQNPPDTYRGMPIFPRDVYEAGDKPAMAGKLVLFSLNQLGLGNFQTYDISNKSFYQILTQIDPTVGRLAGRVINESTGYGHTEEERRPERLQLKEQAQSREAKRGAGAEVADFFIANAEVTRDKRVRDYQMKKGMSYAEASQLYPNAFFAPKFAGCARILTAYQKQIDAMQKNPKYTKTQIDTFIRTKQAQMNAIAKKTLQEYKATKVRRMMPPPTGESPLRLPEPPE